MEQLFVPMRDGKKLFVQYCDSRNKDTIVWVHGGPGNGCWDFIYAAELLSKYYNIIMFDQRGVMRSDAIEENDNFTSEDLIDDLEDLRQYFDLDNMILMGHSYGGMLILRYAKKYPHHINKLMYVCPSFSMLLSMSNIFKLAKSMVSSEAEVLYENIDEALKLNNMGKYIETIMTFPEELQMKVYGDIDFPPEIAKIIVEQGLKDEEWQKSAIHHQKIFNESHINDNYVNDLKDIHIPSALILGENDPVCCPIQIDGFKKNAYEAQIATVKDVGHIFYRYKPNEFVDCVRKLI